MPKLVKYKRSQQQQINYECWTHFVSFLFVELCIDQTKTKTKKKWLGPNAGRLQCFGGGRLDRCIRNPIQFVWLDLLFVCLNSKHSDAHKSVAERFNQLRVWLLRGWLVTRRERRREEKEGETGSLQPANNNNYERSRIINSAAWLHTILVHPFEFVWIQNLKTLK